MQVIQTTPSFDTDHTIIKIDFFDDLSSVDHPQLKVTPKMNLIYSSDEMSTASTILYFRSEEKNVAVDALPPVESNSSEEEQEEENEADSSSQEENPVSSASSKEEQQEQQEESDSPIEEENNTSQEEELTNEENDDPNLPKRQKQENSSQIEQILCILAILLLISSAFAACIFGFNPFTLAVLRLFQTITLLANIGKTNITFENLLTKIFEYLSMFDFPQNSLTNKFTLINSQGTSKNYYLLYTTGLKGKISESKNQGIFFFSGLNLYFGLAYLITWLITQKMLKKKLKISKGKKSILLTVKFMAIIFCYKYQFLAMSELAYHLPYLKQNWISCVSYFGSLFCLCFLNIEIYQSWEILNKRKFQDDLENRNQENILEFRNLILEGIELEGLNEKGRIENGTKNLKKIVKFMTMQIVIVGLQRLPVAQTTLLLMIELLFLTRNLKKNFKSNFYESGYFLYKERVQLFGYAVLFTGIWLLSLYNGPKVFGDMPSLKTGFNFFIISSICFILAEQIIYVMKSLLSTLRRKTRVRKI